MKKCECGKDMFELVEGKSFCKKCFFDILYSTAFQCMECKKYFNIKSLISYGEKYFCKKCHDISHE